MSPRERKQRDRRLLRAEELLTWGRSLDSEMSKLGAISADNRRTAAAMIEQALNEADAPQHRGGHHGSARRELMPWEAEREAHLADLIEAAQRGRLNRRIPRGSCRRLALA